MNKDWLVIIFVILATVGVISAAAYFSGGGQNQLTPVGGSTKFRAREGTMKDNVMPMVSAKQQKMDKPKPVSEVLEKPKPHSITVPESRVREAVETSASPEQIIEKLERELHEASQPEHASALRRQMAETRLLIIPSDEKEAKEALTQAKVDAQAALDSAQGTEERRLASKVLADVMIRSGQDAEARICLQEVLLEEATPTPGSLDAGMLKGVLDEKAGDDVAAENSFKRVMLEAEQLVQDPNAPAAVEQYSLAALKLSRLYRASGRDDEADAVAREASAKLAVLRTSP